MARSRSRSRGRTDDDVATGEVRPFRKGKKGIGSPKTKKIPTLTYKVIVKKLQIRGLFEFSCIMNIFRLVT